MAMVVRLTLPKRYTDIGEQRDCGFVRDLGQLLASCDNMTGRDAVHLE